MTIPTSVAATSVVTSNAKSTTGRTRSVCSTNRSSRCAPRRPSSTKATALWRDMRVIAVSDKANSPVKPMRTTMTTTRMASVESKLWLPAEAITPTPQAAEDHPPDA